jgi:PP-loop superfamily ATP-utilizing enzyme
LQSDREMEVSEATKGLRGKLNKVVLAYSGGLDTSVIVPWLRYVSSYVFRSPLFCGLEHFP